MLSDDITGAMSTGIRMVGAVARGLVRGAVLGVVAAFAIGTFVAAWPLLAAGVGALMAGSIGAGLQAIGVGLIGGMATMFGAATGVTSTIAGAAIGPGLMLTGAKIGGLLLGATSIIPGISDMWSGAKSTLNDREGNVYQPAQGQQRVQTVEYDNPAYEEGKGAKLMARGNGNSQSVQSASR